MINFERMANQRNNNNMIRAKYTHLSHIPVTCTSPPEVRGRHHLRFLRHPPGTSAEYIITRKPSSTVVSATIGVHGVIRICGVIVCLEFMQFRAEGADSFYSFGLDRLDRTLSLCRNSMVFES